VRQFIKWWLPVVVWMGLIFTGSSVGNIPRVGGPTLDGLAHRVAHLVEFAILGGLVLRAASKGRPVTKREIMITLVTVAVYGASDEFHQRYTPGRSSEGLSVLFDVAGGMIGAWVYRQWQVRRRVTEQPKHVVGGSPESVRDASANRRFDQ
jgi:VanZ family protein